MPDNASHVVKLRGKRSRALNSLTMKNKTWLWVLGIVAVLFLLFIGSILVAVRMAMEASTGTLASGNVALLHVQGIITSGVSSPSFFASGGTGSESFVKKLDEIGENPGFKAIVIRVNSPGGAAAGSQEIYQKLMELRRKGKKIVVSMGDAAASGAYYISSAADKIYAEPATLTGSIGVIAELMDLQGLYKKIGVSPETLKSGKMKDMGNSSRPLTAEEKKLFQTMLDQVHGQFISDVAAGRNLPVATIRALADGRVYTGEQALKLHLIDSIGSLDDAESEAAHLSGIIGKPKVINLDQKTFFEQLSEGASSAAPLPGILSELRQDCPGYGIFFLAPDLPTLR